MGRAKPPPRRKLPPPAAPSSRERVLRAALEVFADVGYDAAGTTEVARRAGVTQPLVHYHFATKELLWQAAVAELFARLSVLGDAGAASLRDLDPVSRLKVMLRRYVQFSAAHPEVSRFLQREGVRDSARLRWLVEQHARPLSQSIAALLADAQSHGALKHLDVRALSCLLVTAGAQVFTVPALIAAEHDLDVRDPAVIDRYADTLIEVLFHGAVTAPHTP